MSNDTDTDTAALTVVQQEIQKIFNGSVKLTFSDYNIQYTYIYSISRIGRRMIGFASVLPTLG